MQNKTESVANLAPSDLDKIKSLEQSLENKYILIAYDS